MRVIVCPLGTVVNGVNTRTGATGLPETWVKRVMDAKPVIVVAPVIVKYIPNRRRRVHFILRFFMMHLSAMSSASFESLFIAACAGCCLNILGVHVACPNTTAVTV